MLFILFFLHFKDNNTHLVLVTEMAEGLLSSLSNHSAGFNSNIIYHQWILLIIKGYGIFNTSKLKLCTAYSDMQS